MRKGVRAGQSGGRREKSADVQPGVPADPAGRDAAAPAVGGEAGAAGPTCLVILRTADGRWDYRVVGHDNRVLLSNEGLPDVWAALEEVAAYWPGA